MAYVQVALAIIAMVLMIIQKGKNKGKSGNIGKRYWADTIQGLVSYSPRIAKLWVNRIFDSSENGQWVASYIPYASAPGDQWNVPSIGVFRAAVTGFSQEYAPNIEWNNQDCVNVKRNCIPNMVKGHAWATPTYPCHLQGAAVVCFNQTYMGLNGAQYPSYQAIVTAIPGTVYNIMDAAPEYCNVDYWVRYRQTIDCANTVTLNPVVIVAEILLDQMKPDEIDWVSFAEAGRKLHKEYPFMWFSMQFGEMSVKNALDTVLEKARLAIKTMPDGRIGLRVVGEIPEDGIMGLSIIDALKELTDFTISKPALSAADVVNIASGSYAAARADNAVMTIYDVYSQVIPYDEMDAFIRWMDANSAALMGKGIYEVVQMYPGYKSEWDIAHAANQVAQMAGREWHFKTADIYAINAANIVSTGIRKQENFDIDFLNWPDDASAYLQEVLIQYEKPYCSATITSGMRLWDKTVGDSIRLVIEDKEAAITVDKVFTIEEMEVNSFPEETITFTLKENSKWYGVLDPKIGEPGNQDPFKFSIYLPNSAVENPDGSHTLSDGTIIFPDGKVTLPAGTTFNPETDVYTTPNGYRYYADGTLLMADGSYIVVPPRGTDTTPTPNPYEPEEVEVPTPDQLFQIPMVGHTTSPFLRGVPATHFAVNWSTPIMVVTREYLVDSLSPDAIREKDNELATGSKTWPFNFELDESVTIPAQYEGSLDGLEIHATMWKPEVAKIDQILTLFKNNTASLAGTPGDLYDTDYDGVGYAIISEATRNSPSGLGLLLRYTFMDAHVENDNLKISLRGLFLCDAPLQTYLPVGSIISLLPVDSNALSTGASCYPVPEAYGVMEQGAGQAPFGRTVVGSVNGELMWNRCYAAQYYVNGYWNYTLPFTIWAHNRSNPLGGYGELDSVTATLTDIIDIWLDAFDFRTTAVNKNLLNASTAMPPAGLDAIMSGNQTSVLIDSNDAQAGINGLVAELIIADGGQPLAKKLITGNRVHTSFSLNQFGSDFTVGKTYQTIIRARYDLLSDFIDQPTSTRDIDIEGPVIHIIGE